MRYFERCVLLWLATLLPAFSTTENNAVNSAKPEQALYGEVNILALSCSAAGLTLSSFRLPCTIDKVCLGSAAFYSGLLKNDRIISAKIEDNKLCLLINRTSHRFSVKLKTATSLDAEDSLISRTALQRSSANDRAINGRTLREQLVDHDLVLIVDCSKSMGTLDCPNTTSRWNWCAKQSFDLAQVADEASSSVSIVFFNNDSTTYRNIQSKYIPSLFSKYSPEGGTLLAKPLMTELDRYFGQRTKPLIIVIISDGMPQDASSVAVAMQEANFRLRYSGEVTIIFLLVGKDIDDFNLRMKFNQNIGSISTGAVFDVVPFAESRSRGVKSVLQEELNAARLVVDTSKR